jgi:hypothetical protein
MEDWSAAYALATRTALLSPDVNSVTVCGYAELVQNALAQVGLQSDGTRLMRVGGDRGRLAGLPRPHLSFCDYDAAFFTA